MLTYHITKTQKELGSLQGKWCWTCSCKQSGFGYLNEHKAKLGARLHRATISLDASNEAR